jgi:hypothetical protein
LIKLFISNFRLDSSFAEAVHEFAEFREGYQDAQVPRASFTPPNDEQRRSYIRTLERQLNVNFGTHATAVVTQTDCGTEFGLRSLEAALVPTGGIDRVDRVEAPRVGLPVSIDYIATSQIAVDVGSARVTIAKPFMRAAWTMDRAYADAQRVINELLLA